MEKAAFKLDSFSFPKATLNFENVPDNATLSVNFIPMGEYNKKSGIYKLNFTTIVKCDNTETELANVCCQAFFSFNAPIEPTNIPAFFYPNSLAILFPYVRAFISTVSLQSNIRPVVLPTLNLSGLEEKLRNNTTIE